MTSYWTLKSDAERYRFLQRCQNEDERIFIVECIDEILLDFTDDNARCGAWDLIVTDPAAKVDDEMLVKAIKTTHDLAHRLQILEIYLRQTEPSTIKNFNVGCMLSLFSNGSSTALRLFWHHNKVAAEFPINCIDLDRFGVLASIQDRRDWLEEHDEGLCQ
jgi:hypothetical protein